MQIDIKPKIQYTCSGTQKQFDFPFDYLRKAFVHVKVNDAEMTDFRLVGKTIYFTTAPSAGSKLVIYRSTITKRLVSWADASVMRANDLTITQVQYLHILEEVQDDLQNWTLEKLKELLNELILDGIKLDVDEFLSLVSTNPVQNKVITAEIERLKNLIKYGGGGGSGILAFNTMADLISAGLDSLKDGREFKLLGYYKPYDGGGANYICKYLWSAAAYPWAIDLGVTEEIEYQYVYKLDGTPEVDPATGEYVILKDEKGNPVPVYEADGVTPKYKHLYAVITDTVVNYAMFGAKLDGETDDYDAIYMAHKYQHDNFTIEPLSGRRHYYIKVENHSGIIRKDNNKPIVCSGDIDLSGSQLLVQDCNATWFGFYLWGDNEEDYMTYEPLADARNSFVKDNFVINVKGNEGDVRPNSLINFREDPYAVRDDGGYLYSEPRYELLLHTADGVLANPFTENWDSAGGLEIAAPFSDYNTHETRTETLISHLTTSYTRLPATHYYFTGCAVKLATTANKYCSVLWCKCHNAHIKGFTFEVDSTQLHNTVFKNTMIYLWGAYNVELSDIVGFNAAGKKDGSTNGTSGYVFRATNCFNLNIHDISVQGYWGATAMNCVKDVHLTRVNINRLDIHNYFYNLYIDNCNLYNHAIQIGEGRGICQITNSNFYVNNLEGDSYPNAHILEFNLTYGRIFEGKVLIENCNAFIKDANGDEFDVCKIDFSPEAVSTLDHYKFPEVTIRNCHFYAYNPATYLVYFMIAGTRNCKTSTKAPTNVKDYCRDTGNDDTGTLMWKYIGRGVDWIDNGDSSSARLDVVKGQIIRTYDKYIDSDDKTVFYNQRYFVVTAPGTLPVPTENNKPTDYSGNEFSIGTGCKLKCVTDCRWEASKQYKQGDYCFTESSYFLPVFCYECTVAGRSNGYRPLHTVGKAIEGVDTYPQNLDACWWEYVKPMDDFVTKTFTPDMTVETGDVLYVDGRLYNVIQGGKLKEVPPLDTAWNGNFIEGTAKLGFIGKDWAAKTWWSQGSYCISTSDSGIRNIYKLVDQDGTTSGSIPVPGNARTVDGDIMWENDDSAAVTKGAWQAQTQYYVGDVVSNNGHNYKCVFDGRLELPHQTVIEDVSTNMTGGGDVFAFWEKGTDVPTKFNSRGKWVIKIDNVEHYRFRTFNNGYFCHTGNPQPTILEVGSGSSSSGSSSGGTTANITKVSQLENDAGYVTANHQHAASTITGLAKVATSGDYNDLKNKPASGGDSGGDSGGGSGGDTGEVTTYLDETITSSGASAWLDSKILTIPEGMTKVKITASATGGGSVEVRCVTASEPWAETSTLVKLENITAAGKSAVLNVATGMVRPIFNYYNGTAESALTIKCEGSSAINNEEAAATFDAYTG